MTFWSRIFCAIVCWFLSVLAILATVKYYLSPELTLSGLGQKLLFGLGVGIVMIAVLVAVLVFWMWVWVRKYWSS